jgi:hypothetical protein
MGNNENKIGLRATNDKSATGPGWAGALLLIFLGQSDWEQASVVNSFGFERFFLFSEKESRARPALGRQRRARENTSRSMVGRELP